MSTERKPSPALLPCPFCGSEVALDVHQPKGWPPLVKHPRNPMCCLSDHITPSNSWNTRADISCSSTHPEIRYQGEKCPLCEAIRDRDNASDGHHTFKELYEHRHALFAALSNSQGGWKSKLHDDGTMFDGWFIAGCTTPTGPVTYHFPLEWWETFPAVALYKAPAWDGHTSADVVDRIKSLSRPSSDPGAGEVGK